MLFYKVSVDEDKYILWNKCSYLVMRVLVIWNLLITMEMKAKEEEAENKREEMIKKMKSQADFVT